MVDRMNGVDNSVRSEVLEMLEGHLARIELELAQHTSELRAEIERRAVATEPSLLRWMISLWFAQMGALVGLALPFKQFWS
jgi:hypothetical protein